VAKQSIPFYTQSTVLDRYLHASHPDENPAVLEVILETLRTQPALRDYFFRSRPSPAWARILYEYGFLNAPPPPRQAEGGMIFPRWDVQEYLITVASEASDVVINHILSLDAPTPYIARAIQALSYVPPIVIAPVLPRVLAWLADLNIASTTASETCLLLERLLEAGQTKAAYNLFRALTVPVLTPEARSWDRVTSGLHKAFGSDRPWYDKDSPTFPVLELLAQRDAEQLIHLLEDQLCTALQLESSVDGTHYYETQSWWRSAIEDTNQDILNTYKDKLLQTLRATAEQWVQRQGEETSIVEQFLASRYAILRRLGLHLLHRFPTVYPIQVQRELMRSDNWVNVDIHHEFFLLLRQSFPVLTNTAQQALLQLIHQGPPAELVQDMAEWAQRTYRKDLQRYAEEFRKRWIYERLWMIRDYLTGESAQLFIDLMQELGEPDHPPEFTRWSESYTVLDISPVQTHELAQMSANELVAFVRQWTPPAEQPSHSKVITYGALAGVFAPLMLAHLPIYEPYLAVVAVQRPEYANALLGRLANDAEFSKVPWETSVTLCEALLAHDAIRGGAVWDSVRQSIAWLLEKGVVNKDRYVPPDLLPRVRDLLIALASNSETIEAERSIIVLNLQERDIATEALNRVRPTALRGLIHYTVRRIEIAAEQAGVSASAVKRSIEPAVRDVLTRNLSSVEDTIDWTVHSVYGRELATLWWLDTDWVTSHIDAIFPEGDDDHQKWLFVCAWESFVIFNYYYPSLARHIHSKYERAIAYLTQGYTTKTHLMLAQQFAVHIVWEYLRSAYEIHADEGQRSLIAQFLRLTTPEARGHVAWAIWRICAESLENRERYWPRARTLWAWRAHEASAANHSADFDDEMGYFVHLTSVAPSSESIQSLWPLLESSLPHVSRSHYRNHGREAIEDYLIAEVERDPLRSIQFYRLMQEQRPREMEWFYSKEEIRKMIVKALADERSRATTLALLDTFARQGNHQYRDLYEQYSR
jgi:hypothetical protein